MCRDSSILHALCMYSLVTHARANLARQHGEEDLTAATGAEHRGRGNALRGKWIVTALHDESCIELSRVNVHVSLVVICVVLYSSA